MSDVAQGPGWWQASDGRWYPPETLAQALGQPPSEAQTAGGGPGQPSGTAPPPGYPGYAGYAPAPGPGPGPGPGHEAAGYGWPGYPPYPAHAPWQRNRWTGALLVLLGVGGLVWGVGELFAALALNNSPVYPHDEQIGAWLVTAGILLASVATIAIGLVHRSRP